MNCDSCFYYNYDEDFEQYYCDVNLDEDDYAKFITYKDFNCSHYLFHDDYQMVKKQN